MRTIGDWHGRYVMDSPTMASIVAEVTAVFCNRGTVEIIGRTLARFFCGHRTDAYDAEHAIREVLERGYPLTIQSYFMCCMALEVWCHPLIIDMLKDQGKYHAGDHGAEWGNEGVLDAAWLFWNKKMRGGDLARKLDAPGEKELADIGEELHRLRRLAKRYKQAMQRMERSWGVQEK